MRINYSAPGHVSNVLASFERAEDVKFSPSNRRLGLAMPESNKVAILSVRPPKSADQGVLITDVFVICSTLLKYPHGIDFLDEDRLVVANRQGDLAIFKLRSSEAKTSVCGAEPLAILTSSESRLLSGPGSVAITKMANGLYQALVCNCYAHYVTRHILDLSDGFSIRSSEILLRKNLYIPDGVCVSRDNQWIAISNHQMQTVHLYKNSSSLNELAEPDGILRCAQYPHGLRFTPDNRFLLAADAGAPYVHIYQAEESDWRGVRNPVASYRILSNEDYLRARNAPEEGGRIAAEEGGSKGIDIDNSMSTLVSTSECQPLAFFDFSAILGQLHRAVRPTDLWADTGALELSYELDIRANACRSSLRADQAQALARQKETRVTQVEERAIQAEARANQAKERAIEAAARATEAEARAVEAEARALRADSRVHDLLNSTSWRGTAPLRWMSSTLRKLALVTGLPGGFKESPDQ